MNRSDNKPAPRGGKAPRKIRNEHGTRVARSIVCSHCGERDTIHFSPRNADRTLCRRCAADLLGVADEDAGIRPERDLLCTACGKEERTTYDRDEPFECRDCRRGIWSKQQDRSRGAERLGDKGRVLRVRRDGGPHDKG